MVYQNKKIAEVAEVLKKRLETLEHKPSILRDPELKALAAEIPRLMPEQRAEFGKELNQLKAELIKLISDDKDKSEKLTPIDITAPFDVNSSKKPQLLTSDNGNTHPLMSELS